MEPEGDMKPVKPREHEKGRAISATGELEVEFRIGVAIFPRLQAHEDKSQGEGQEQAELELAPLVELECPMRPGHGNARRQQYERIDCRKTPRPHGSEFLLIPGPDTGQLSGKAGHSNLCSMSPSSGTENTRI